LRAVDIGSTSVHVGSHHGSPRRAVEAVSAMSCSAMADRRPTWVIIGANDHLFDGWEVGGVDPFMCRRPSRCLSGSRRSQQRHRGRDRRGRGGGRRVRLHRAHVPGLPDRVPPLTPARCGPACPRVCGAAAVGYPVAVPATNHRGSGITDASPLCRSPGWQPPRHSASTIGRRRAALRSGDRPARPRRTHPQPYALNRSPPEAHRRTGCGARASRPRRRSSEAERRRAGGGRSPLRPSVRVVHHSRSVPVECRQSSAAHEGFGERSRWGAVSTPRYRSALSNNRRADPRSRQAGIC
jgi:hypothetical protein